MNKDLPLLSSAILHEVKNHLAELQLRLSRRDDTSAEQALIASCTQRLSDLLLVQRDDAGHLNANISADSPADLLKDLALGYGELFPSLKISIHTDDAPTTAFYDAFLVRLALSNALHNACRHARKQVRLTARSTDGNIIFEISDDGGGFPPALLKLGITAPSRPSSSGTGLGLYLAGRIATLHHLDSRTGRVELSNNDAGGGTFLLILP